MATITFDNIQSGGTTGPTYTYTEGGFTFGPSPTSGDGGRVFGVTNNGDGVFAYNGNALTSDNGAASFASGEIRASDGSRFTPNSIQLNQLYNGSPGGSVRFFGSRNGTTVTFQDFSFDNDGSTSQTATFLDSFQNIDSLSFTTNTAARQVQLDNFVATPVCFTTGTLIRTARGDVAVEALRVGDLAVTSSGTHRPIRWIGSRTIDCRNHPEPHRAHPVRIRAHALGENRPVRDLVVSPGHSLCLDVLGEVLIPAMALVNGATIAQEAVDSVTYWHVELDSHDILVAEAQPAESYLDMGNRGFFAESSVVDLDAAPDADAAARTLADFCRPYVADGVVLDAVRAQIQARADRLGWRLDDDPWADMHLMVDGMRIEADMDGLTARFALPAAAEEVWLVSKTNVPSQVANVPDGRRLGLCLTAITIDDGSAGTRSVPLDDPRLSLGFHHCEEGVRRWTAGQALLPAELFAGCRGPATLRLDLAGSPLPRWIGPEATAEMPEAVAA